MKYFKDEHNEHYAYEDDIEQEVIDQLEIDANITLASMTDAEYNLATTPTLDDLKTFRRIDIEFEFSSYSVMPVTVDSVEFNGGFLASTEYKAAYDFAEMSGQTAVGFRDTAGNKHVMSLTDAKSVLMAIGSDYFTKDAQRDDLIAAVLAATTEDELAAIVIGF